MKHTPINKRSTEVALSAEEFKSIGRELIDNIGDLHASLGEHSLTTHQSSEALASHLKTAFPLLENGQKAEDVLEKATKLLFDHSLYNGHPKFWGYITSSPTPIGALGDLLAAAINPNVGAAALSPIATEIEKQTIEWIGQFIGYPAEGGLLCSGGNMANHICFLAALRAKVGNHIRRFGLRGLPKEPVMYCSRETHTWVQKSADLAGLGTECIRWIDTDKNGQIDIVYLNRAILKDLANGYEPFMVVGTAGTVSTGVVDPLDEIAAICEAHKLWFHIDGAYGACAAGIPELAETFAGFDMADSIAMDPHKWLYAPLEAGCVLVKNSAHLTDTFSYKPPYYNFGESATNFYDYGPQNSRGFRALKVWLSFQHLGLSGHRQLIREDIQLSKYAYEKFDKINCFEVFANHLSITTFRYVPSWLKAKIGEPDTEKYLNEFNEKLLNKIEQSGRFFLSKAMIRGKFALRMCIVNFRTVAQDVDELLMFIYHLAQDLDIEMSEAA